MGFPEALEYLHALAYLLNGTHAPICKFTPKTLLAVYSAPRYV